MRTRSAFYRIPCLAVACLLLSVAGCKNLDAAGNAPLKTPPKGLPHMKRIDKPSSSGGSSPDYFF